MGSQGWQCKGEQRSGKEQGRKKEKGAGELVFTMATWPGASILEAFESISRCRLVPWTSSDSRPQTLHP